MADQIDPERLRALTEKILKTVLQPALLEQLKKAQSAPGSEFFTEASKRLTPAALRAAGIDVPPGVRISSRYFDDGTVTSSAVIDTKGGETIVQNITSQFPAASGQQQSGSKAGGPSAGPSQPVTAAGGCVGVGVPPGFCACIGG
jgi:hypothetical protein